MRLLIQHFSWFEESHEKTRKRGINTSQLIYFCSLTSLCYLLVFWWNSQPLWKQARVGMEVNCTIVEMKNRSLGICGLVVCPSNKEQLGSNWQLKMDEDKTNVSEKNQRKSGSWSNKERLGSERIWFPDWSNGDLVSCLHQRFFPRKKSSFKKYGDI